MATNNKQENEGRILRTIPASKKKLVARDTRYFLASSDANRGSSSGGYVSRVPSTFAQSCSEWGSVRVLERMCSTRIARTTRASAMSERWQRQGTASAHIM